MIKFIASLNSFLRTIASLAVVAILGTGLWTGYTMFNAKELAEQEIEKKEEELKKRAEKIQAQSLEISQLSKDVEVKRIEIEKQKREIARQKREIERLDLAMKFLKHEQPIGQIVVLDQGKDADGTLFTKLRFVEVDKQGNELEEPHDITIEGDICYVDSWVVKFDDVLVEAGPEKDPLRASSIAMFRRIFGEYQKPNDGHKLFAVGVRPRAYSRGEPMSELEQEIWANFWDWANDPDRQKKAQVRSVSGEAPSIQLRKGKIYKLRIRASGGIDFKAEDLPAAVRDSL